MSPGLFLHPRLSHKQCRVSSRVWVNEILCLCAWMYWQLKLSKGEHFGNGRSIGGQSILLLLSGYQSKNTFNMIWDTKTCYVRSFYILLVSAYSKLNLHGAGLTTGLYKSNKKTYFEMLLKSKKDKRQKLKYGQLLLYRLPHKSVYFNNSLFKCSSIKTITSSYDHTHFFEETSIPPVMSFSFCSSLWITPDKAVFMGRDSKRCQV